MSDNDLRARYNTPVIKTGRLRSLLSVPAVLLPLLVLILAPGWLAGRRAEARAVQALAAGDPAAAASDLAYAARHLPGRPDLWEQAGLAYLQAGLPQPAAESLARAARLSAQGQVALGDAWLQLGDEPRAVAAWQAAVPDAQAHRRLALVRQRQGDLQGEAGHWRALLESLPEDAGAHYRLGLILAATQPQDAIPDLLAAARIDPAYDGRVQVLRLRLTAGLTQDDPAYHFVTAGAGLLDVGEPALAVVALRQAVDLRPDYGEAHALLGAALERTGADGLSALQRAVRLAPDSPLVLALNGTYWMGHGDPAGAAAFFTQAAALEPAQPGWQAARAEALALSGDLPAALDAQLRAVELAPLDAHYWRLLAVFSLTYGYNPQGIGLPAAQRAQELAPDDPLVLDTLAWACLDLGLLNQAEAYLLRAVELDPGLASAHLHLGILSLRLGRAPEARQALLRASALDPAGAIGAQADNLLLRYFP